MRIFTNLRLPGLQLPASEGYRFCAPCGRYVSRDNAHCDKCNSCTSKVEQTCTLNWLCLLIFFYDIIVSILQDGRKYHHCDLCGVCVKPGIYMYALKIDDECVY